MGSVNYGPFNTLDDMLFALEKISYEKLDSTTRIIYKNVSGTLFRKSNLLNHRMKNALYSVLCDVKERNASYQRQRLPTKQSDESNMDRLNTMLATEAVIDYNDSMPISWGNSETTSVYKQKLSRIRSFYSDEIHKYEISSHEFVQHSMFLIRDHQRFRPITDDEVHKMASFIRRKLSKIEFELKQNICEIIIGLKSQSVDNRRRRRNFSKHAIDILNEYFYAHHTPYPSEEEKEELARRCEITVSQVSNWFGNKRIRNRKNKKKEEEEANLFRQKKAAEANKYGMLSGYRPAINREEPHYAVGNLLYTAMPGDNWPYRITNNNSRKF